MVYSILHSILLIRIEDKENIDNEDDKNYNDVNNK